MQGLATNTNHAAGPALVAQPAAYRQLGLRLQYVHTADAIWELAGRRPTVLSIHYGALAQLIGAASSDTGRRHLEHVAAAGVVRIRERRRGLAIVDVVSPEAALLSWRAKLAPLPPHPDGYSEQLELFEPDVLNRGGAEARREEGACAESEPVLPSPRLRVSAVRSVPFFGEQTRKKPATFPQLAGNVPATSPQREPDPEREQFLKLMEVRRRQDPACRPAGPVPMVGEVLGAEPANVHVSVKETSRTYTCSNRGGAEARRKPYEPDRSGSPAVCPESPRLRVSAVRSSVEVLPSDAEIVDGKQAELERRARAASILPSVYRKVAKAAVQGRLPFDELLDVVAQADAIERKGQKFAKSRGAYIVGGFRQVYQRHGVAWFRQAQAVS